MEFEGTERPRLRAMKEDYKVALRERAGAEPLNRQLGDWHCQAARLAGIVNSRLLNNRPVGDAGAEVRDLLEVVQAGFESWRRGFDDRSITGRLRDAERSCLSLIATLRDLSDRIRLQQ